MHDVPLQLNNLNLYDFFFVFSIIRFVKGLAKYLGNCFPER